MIANENVADESAMLNINRESLASHTDVPNWHTVKMMPLHGVCEPIHLTALMQIRYFAKYKFRKTAGKFYFNLYFNELNNAQEPLEKTDPGSRPVGPTIVSCKRFVRPVGQTVGRIKHV